MESRAMLRQPALRRRRMMIALAGLPFSACVMRPALVNPVAPPAVLPPAPRVRTGDRWRYVETNAYNGERIAEVAHEAVEVGERIRMRLTDSRGRPRPDEAYARAWIAVTEATFDFPQTYEQPMPVVPEPLVVGPSSRLRTAYRVPDASSRFAWQQYLDAIGWERVRVPAGEFDALRIERRIWFTHVDHMRIDSFRSDVLWYAPTVNRWVRREWTGTYRWPGMRWGAPLREDWVVQELLDYMPSPRMGTR